MLIYSKSFIYCFFNNPKEMSDDIDNDLSKSILIEFEFAFNL